MMGEKRKGLLGQKWIQRTNFWQVLIPKDIPMERNKEKY